MPLSYIFGAGALAGVLVDMLSSPIELAKIRMQCQKDVKLYNGSIDCIRKTFKYEGLRGVYKGTGLTLLRDVIGCGSYFALFEYFMRSDMTKNYSRAEIPAS